MKKIHFYPAIIFILLSLFALPTFAWNNSIEIGYGKSHDPNHTEYDNSGFLLTADLYPFRHTPYTYWSLNGALGQWYASAPKHKHLNTAALALALRLYPFTTALQYTPYILGSVGPALLSTRKYGLNTQGANVAFQFNLGLGVEVKNIDLNFRAVHYSNAYLATPDQGYSILYMLSLGYLF